MEAMQSSLSAPGIEPRAPARHACVGEVNALTNWASEIVNHNSSLFMVLCGKDLTYSGEPIIYSLINGRGNDQILLNKDIQPEP